MPSWRPAGDVDLPEDYVRCKGSESHVKLDQGSMTTTSIVTAMLKDLAAGDMPEILEAM
jgi:hypothetical protein